MPREEFNADWRKSPLGHAATMLGRAVKIRRVVTGTGTRVYQICVDNCYYLPHVYARLPAAKRAAENFLLGA